MATTVVNMAIPIPACRRYRRGSDVADKTANEKIRDGLLQRHIYLHKYADGVKKKIAFLLDSTEGDVRAAIERTLATLTSADGSFFDFNAGTNAHLAALRDKIHAIRSVALAKALADLEADLAFLGPNEAHYLNTLVKKVSPVVLKTKMPAHDKLAALGGSTPI